MFEIFEFIKRVETNDKNLKLNQKENYINFYL